MYLTGSLILRYNFPLLLKGNTQLQPHATGAQRELSFDEKDAVWEDSWVKGQTTILFCL